MPFLGPWTTWEPLTSAPWSILHPFHDSICDLLKLFDKRHVPCSVPQTQEAPTIQQAHKNTHSRINQLRFWVTTSMTNKSRQQGLNPRIWFNVHILYILLVEPCLSNYLFVWLYIHVYTYIYISHGKDTMWASSLAFLHSSISELKSPMNERDTLP